MTIKNDIVELLSKRELYMTQISAELQIPKERLMVYLNQLLKSNKIKRTKTKKPYKYAAITSDNSIDTQILIKMLKVHIQAGTVLTDTTEIEDKRIEELITKCL